MEIILFAILGVAVLVLGLQTVKYTKANNEMWEREEKIDRMLFDIIKEKHG